MAKPMLYHACLAYASHVMSLDGRVDKEVEARLNNKVISILIPLLSNTESLENGVLISALVILKMSEQFYELGGMMPSATLGEPPLCSLLPI
jgi:hypothetical protein